MKKYFRIVLFLIFFGVICIFGAGIYRFNFTNDDIYVDIGDGEVLPYDVYIEGVWH